MSLRNLSPRAALTMFVALVVFVLAMATWWIIFMARLTNEKVEIARKLNASPEFLEELHRQEIVRQIMVGSEGVVFLLLVLFGVWLIYRSLRQAETLRHRQENFVMAVTHELKTPMASIGVYLDTLQSEKIPVEKKTQVIPKMKNDLHRLERLVDDILEAGRFEAGESRLNLQPVDLGALLHTLADGLAERHDSGAVRIVRHVDAGVGLIGDSAVLGRALGAILDNAVKYAGGQPPHITVTLRQSGHHAEIVIADKGVGIQKQELELIFERFYRVGHEMTRASRGTGLGLYLCREMIRAHGGEVMARSEGIGHGTEFIVTLPLGKKS
jgi:two-component system sensor histidine kinase CiaH